MGAHCCASRLSAARNGFALISRSDRLKFSAKMPLCQADCMESNFFLELAASYAKLAPRQRQRFMGMFSEHECSRELPDFADPFEFHSIELKAKAICASLKEAMSVSITVAEVISVLHHWRLSLSLNLPRRDRKILASRAVAKDDIVAYWALPEMEVWWMGADRRLQALKKNGIVAVSTPICGCARCVAYDVCREFSCPECQGPCWHHGELKKWTCQKCKKTIDPTKLPIDQEESLAEKTVAPIESDEVSEYRNLVAECEQTLGGSHWITNAARWRYVFLKPCNFESISVSLLFLTWFDTRHLPTPPPSFLGPIIRMVVRILVFFNESDANLRIDDWRVVYGRLLRYARRLLQHTPADSLIQERTTVSEFPDIEENVCGYCCVSILPQSSPNANIDDEYQKFVCCHCNLLTYCSAGCQVQDWRRRHKLGCTAHHNLLLPPSDATADASTNATSIAAPVSAVDAVRRSSTCLVPDMTREHASTTRRRSIA
eukprot:GEMP01034800.1.p1 GENE.GEMP01034800.1~~GEMP01034800.1.p1  ORF type:complete len:489 (+),score=69.20 GEMP01034800.1:125-1591(+)